MTWLDGSATQLGLVAAKATLIYLTAVFGLRLGERRTLAQWSIIDAAAAVAVGAIIGRTAVDDNQSYLTGATALLTIIAAHRLISVARLHPRFARLVQHRTRVLVANGHVRRGQLRLCGLTDDDLYAELRLRGVFDLADVRYVLFEPTGGLTVVPPGPGSAAGFVERGLHTAAGYHPQDEARADAPTDTGTGE